MTYAPLATPEFNARLHDALRALTDDVRRLLGPNLVGLVLGGGYGRGEGGIVTREGVEKPYNDLDLALVVRSPHRVPTAALDRIRERHARLLGVHVDLTRPLTVDEIRRWPCCMMWQDFLRGHVVLSGPEDLLKANAPPEVERPLPAIEATRLLLNRGAGLLWAWRVALGAEPEPDPDFVRRNYHKCGLALGDALLILAGQFTTRYRGRDLRLAGLLARHDPLPRVPLLRMYRQATRFKFRPDDVETLVSTSQMRPMNFAWKETFLHVEGARCGREFSTPADYEGWRVLREPDRSVPRAWLRNLVLNMRQGRWSVIYPREALFRALPRLLHVAAHLERADSGGQDAGPGMGPAAWERESRDFLDRWQRCN